VLVSNTAYELTHFAGAGTRAKVDAGTLGVTAARIRSAADVAKLVAFELIGEAGRFPNLLSWTAQEFEVRSSGPVEVGLDGEALMMAPPLRFVSMRGALRVRLPRAAGLAPAASAVSLTVSNLNALAKVAAGR
jgi:diacylglycerol kinase family enzyme